MVQRKYAIMHTGLNGGMWVGIVSVANLNKKCISSDGLF